VTGGIAFATGGGLLLPGGRGSIRNGLGDLGVYVNGQRIATIVSAFQTIAIPAGVVGVLAFKYEDDPNTCGDNSGSWFVSAVYQ
jgi:hypothetical protein